MSSKSAYREKPAMTGGDETVRVNSHPFLTQTSAPSTVGQSWRNFVPGKMASFPKPIRHLMLRMYFA